MNTDKNMTTENTLHTEFTQTYVDLLAARVGGQALACSDDFFASMENLIKPGRGIFIEDKYTDRGKWMDGWESRRRFGRTSFYNDSRGARPGIDHDWCILRLGIPGIIRGIDADTNHFRGNAPQTVSLEACVYTGESQNPLPEANMEWVEILPQSPVQPHSRNLFRINSDKPWTHMRFNIFPDGGVARLRIYGEQHIDWNRFLPGEPIDLAAVQNGGRALLCSDMFFSDKNNLLMPDRGINMGDGWETKRRRDNGNDWVIVKLAAEGSINKVLIDTHHFKGNYPDRFSLEGIVSGSDDFDSGSADWQTIIPQTPLAADREHLFIDNIVSAPAQTFTHVRLNIFPDGGVSRMRLFGYRKGDTQ